MSLYNMMNGVTQATFYVLPMLGKHPDEYPRFRDCFTSDDEWPEYNDHIHVYTRTGGGNREHYKDGNNEIISHPNFITDFDDNFDCTFASWIFSVPEKWKDDYEKIKNNKLKDVSKEYQAEIKRVWPKLKDKFDELWGE